MTIPLLGRGGIFEDLKSILITVWYSASELFVHLPCPSSNLVYRFLELTLNELLVIIISTNNSVPRRSTDNQSQVPVEKAYHCRWRRPSFQVIGSFKVHSSKLIEKLSWKDQNLIIKYLNRSDVAADWRKDQTIFSPLKNTFCWCSCHQRACRDCILLIPIPNQCFTNLCTPALCNTHW